MVLAVIPARGGSKGIPRKNVRLMNGKPLIYYAIHNAKNCPSIDDVVVSSDDEEILKIASSYGVETMTRDSELAKDAVTLDPVIYDAVCTMEKKKGIQYDVVITLQVTSPLLSSDTLDKALESFLASSDDTYISVVNKPHLSWTKKDGCYVPNYEKALDFLAENRRNPTLVFLYSVHTDHAGHKYKWMSPEYIRSIEEADVEIGKFLDRMKREGLYEDAHFMFLTDHGGIGHGHGGVSVDEMVVPWGITGPGIAKGKKMTESSNTVNTASVLLKLFRVEQPKEWTGEVPQSIFE